MTKLSPCGRSPEGRQCPIKRGNDQMPKLGFRIWDLIGHWTLGLGVLTLWCWRWNNFRSCRLPRPAVILIRRRRRRILSRVLRSFTAVQDDRRIRRSRRVSCRRRRAGIIRRLTIIIRVHDPPIKKPPRYEMAFFNRNSRPEPQFPIFVPQPSFVSPGGHTRY